MKAKITDAIAKRRNSSFVGRAISLLPPSILLLCVFGLAAQADTTDPHQPVELTKVDLFSQSGWEKAPVAVDGFVLGMTRAQADQVAGSLRLSLRPALPIRRIGELRAACQQALCSVCEIKGNCTGIELGFDSADHISKIAVSFSDDMDPGVKAANVTRRFKGLTHQLFYSYSDQLREQIFGRSGGKETPDLRGSSITHVAYEYPHSGVTVKITIDKRDNPPRAFDLDLDFTAPE